MTHFAIVSPPLTSHVRALEALAGELIERGHRMTWMAQADVQHLISDDRIEFARVGDASHPPGSLTGLVARAARPGGPLGIRRVIRDMASGTDMLCREGRQVLQKLGVEAVIGDQMEAAGGLLAAGLGLPHISVACALPINREPRVPLPVMPWPYASDAAALQRNIVSARLYDWMMKPHGRVVQQQSLSFGLSQRSTLVDCLSPLLQISQTTAGFDFPRTALPEHFHHVGPLRPPSQTEPPLERPISPDAPFVFASLGTLQGGRFGLFKRIAKACKGVGAQLLVAHCGALDARQAQALIKAGASWVTDFAPQRAALARADVAVTHAGLNTVLDALAAGTPMLALPIAFDQPGVAARVRETGAGLVSSAKWASTAAIGRALETLLTNSTFSQSAARLGSDIFNAGGLQKAADLIEAAIVNHSSTEAPAEAGNASRPTHREAHAA